MTPTRLRPLSLSDIFDEGFDLYKRNFAALILVYAIVAVPTKVLESWISLRFLPHLSGLSGSTTDILESLNAMAGGAAILIPVSLLSFAVSFSALATASAGAYLGHPITLRLAYRRPLRQILRLFGLSLLYSLSLVVGVICCYVGVFYPVTVYLFAVHTFALEGQGAFGALRRSRELAKPDANRALSCLISLALLAYVWMIGLQYPLNYLLETVLKVTPGASGWLSASAGVPGVSLRDQILSQITSGIATLFVMPFVACVITVLYYDVRVRTEAFDMEFLAESLHYPPLSSLQSFPPPLLQTTPPPFVSGRPR